MLFNCLNVKLAIICGRKKEEKALLLIHAGSQRPEQKEIDMKYVGVDRTRMRGTETNIADMILEQKFVFDSMYE